jgi:hypothetical protein
MYYRGLSKTTAEVDGIRYGAELRYRQLQDDFITLLPTISIGAPQGTLNLNGVFGDEKGIVTVNDNPVSVTSWTNSVIRVKYPDTGGQVAVVVNGLSSQLLPITEWNGTIAYTATGKGTLKRSVTIAAKFMADVHRYRAVSGANILWPDNDTFGGSVHGVVISSLTSGTYTASGEYRDPQTNELLESWSGGGACRQGRPARKTPGTSFSLRSRMSVVMPP